MARPLRVFRRTIWFELYNFKALSQRQRAVVAAAEEAQAASRDTKIHAGAAALAYDGTLVASANDIPGSFGHAEQRVVSQLYKLLPPGTSDCVPLA